MTEELPWRILVVCTANQCRSPMGEALLANRLANAGISAVVRSCGRLGDGRPVDRSSVAVMAERGLDIAGRLSQPLHAPTLRAADLIITMEQDHVRDVANVEMSAWTKTFPLRGLVARALRVGARGSLPLNEWVAKIHHGRAGADMLSRSKDLDIKDPIGKPINEFRACADELDTYLAQFVSLAASTST